MRIVLAMRTTPPDIKSNSRNRIKIMNNIANLGACGVQGSRLRGLGFKVFLFCRSGGPETEGFGFIVLSA